MVESAIAKIKELFPQAIEIAHPSFITQRGLYLFLGGVEQREQIGGTVSLLLLVAENSLTKSTNSAAALLDSIIEKVQALSVQEGDAYQFGGVKPAVFEGSTLFVYAVEVRVEV